MPSIQENNYKQFFSFEVNYLPRLFSCHLQLSLLLYLCHVPLKPSSCPLELPLELIHQCLLPTCPHCVMHHQLLTPWLHFHVVDIQSIRQKALW